MWPICERFVEIHSTARFFLGDKPFWCALSFNLKYFVRVNKSKCHYLWQLVTFRWRHADCSPSLFWEQKADLNERCGRGNDRQSERDREFMSIRPTSLTHALTSVCLPTLNFWTRLRSSRTSAILVPSASLRFGYKIRVPSLPHNCSHSITSTQLWRIAPAFVLF